MKIPTVSVVIPTFNRRFLLLQAVESCLDQGLLQLDVIIIDDGSSDGTKAMVESRIAGAWNGRGVRYILQNNTGASSARNRGLAMAEGDYVQFLDSDDELLPGKLRKQVEFLEKSESAACQMCYCFGRMGETVDGDCIRIGGKAASVEELLLLLASRQVHVMQTSAPLWRRSFLSQNDGWNPEIGLGDDKEYHVRLVCAGGHFGFIAEELFFVRQHDGSRLGACAMSKKSLESAILTQKRIHQVLRGSGYWIEIIRNTFLKSQGSLYINVLRHGSDESIRDFEDWFYQVAQGSVGGGGIVSAILGRRSLGKNFILICFDLAQKFKGKVRC
ncbi:glycosyltransferase family 2 protein [uncultured Vibrio sp.]|uniref:glycosyltransferase family 2 protein n=1 Tax=uncultured Vibrio sp. TaxID=114054 RepID=UPI002AA6B262|nr:glycosyltransferase family 2 protein [uncultured Vibrio sp.]